MILSEVLFFLALVFWIIACLGISAIGLRNTHWLGTNTSLFAELGTIDRKIAKYSIISFLIGTFFLIAGFLF